MAVTLQLVTNDDEGSNHGRWPRYAPQTAYQQPAKAYDPNRQRPVHGAHRAAVKRAWLYRGGSDAPVYARGDTGLLWRWLRVGRSHPLLYRRRPCGDRGD